MSNHKFRLDLFDLVTSLGKIEDIMSPTISNHHLRVAYLSYRIAEEINVSNDEKYELAIAGALHDIGAFSLDFSTLIKQYAL